MSVLFTRLDEPIAVALAVPQLPDLNGNALVPGRTCPCDEVPIITPTTQSAQAFEHREWCGVRLTTTTTVYTKNEFPGGTPEEEEAWDAAWETITHVVESEMGGPGYSIASNPNFSGSGSFTACKLPEISETWDPGPLDENPGVATYTSESDVDQDEWPEVSLSGFPSFPGDESVVGTNAVASIAADGHSATAFASRWRWKIDLSWWPTAKPWPPGFEFRGALIWDVVTLTYNDPSPDPSSITRKRFVEPYAVTQQAPVWYGEAHVSDATGAASPGRTGKVFVVPVAGFEIVLPLP
jgi:hypothetical protein